MQEYNGLAVLLTVLFIMDLVQVADCQKPFVEGFLVVMRVRRRHFLDKIADSQSHKAVVVSTM